MNERKISRCTFQLYIETHIKWCASESAKCLQTRGRGGTRSFGGVFGNCITRHTRTNKYTVFEMIRSWNWISKEFDGCPIYLCTFGTFLKASRSISLSNVSSIDLSHDFQLYTIHLNILSSRIKKQNQNSETVDQKQCDDMTGSCVQWKEEEEGEKTIMWKI